LVEVVSVAGRRILVVEDEPMIAMMIEDFLKELGWDIVGIAGSLEAALAMVRYADMDAAVLDVNLNGQDSFAAASILGERLIPFVFASGYGSNGIPRRFRDVPVLTKPFQSDELGHALFKAIADRPK
jgi:CheY-like chemotaxis protein